MPGSSSLSPLPVGSSDAVMAGGRRKTRKSKGPSVKAIKRTLKKAGLKVSGKRSTLVKRAKKAHLMGGAEEMVGAGSYGMMGGADEEMAPEAAMEGARRRRRSRKY